MLELLRFFFFFFNDTATTEIYTLSLHDALPIFALRKTESTRWINRSCRFAGPCAKFSIASGCQMSPTRFVSSGMSAIPLRSEEHTSELQSQSNLVCRLLLEKKKTIIRQVQRSQL